MNSDSDPSKPPQDGAPPAGGDFAQRVAKARHDLRNPVAHILGFSEMLIEKARDQGYNFLKGRVELIERLGNEMVERINGCLDPEQIEAGRSEVRALQQLLRKHAAKIISLTLTLGHKPIVRQNETLGGDISRIGGAARRILELSETALAFLSETPDAAAKSGGLAPPAAPAKESLRILLVDDEPEHRENLRVLLSRLGLAVELAEKGSQGLELVAAQPVDLILLDLTMPQPDGLQTLQQLKNNQATACLPVLVLATAGEMDLAIRAIELGAEDYLPKPCHSVLLQARIASAMAKKRLRNGPWAD